MKTSCPSKFKNFCAILLIAFAVTVSADTIYQTSADLNVRSGPSSKYKSIGVVKKGDSVSVIEETNPYWFKIEYNEQSAYVSSKFLNILVIENTTEIQPEFTPEPQPEDSNFLLYLIIGIIAFVIIRTVFSKKKKAKQQSRIIKQQQNTTNELKVKIAKNLLNTMKITVTSSHSTNINNDDSIIDITDQAYKIPSNNNLKILNNSVPFWSHHYVYAYSEIKRATVDQQKFYNIFKINFLNGEYLDLEGNTNYAFILLFDLLNEYENHKDISKLETQLKVLGENYPKTKHYGISFLVKKMEADGHTDEVLRLRTENTYNYYNSSIDYDTYNWRNKYKSKLNLNEDELKILNKIYFPNNNFCSIEFCCIEVVKLFIAVIVKLKTTYKSENTSLEKEFLFVADVVARKHFKFRTGSPNYRYSLESNQNEFYSNIFKHCENTVREFYGHKRKISTDTYYSHEEAITEFESRIISKVVVILPTLISTITPPDESTEVELYSQTTTRWKLKFDELTKNYKNNAEEFIQSVIKLGKLNKKNPSIENIFFEASKFIAKHDKVAALTLYMHYLHHDLKSSTFDNKQLTKTIQKNLFKTNEQLHDFEMIVSDFINDKDLGKAVKAVPKVYEIKRKKIKLDRTSIEEAQKQHSGTVELLNEYLQDEFEDEHNTIQAQEINSEEINIKIIQKNEEAYQSPFLNELSFNHNHISILELFSKNNFSISQTEIEDYAKSKGIFKNQVIESINETCYEVLDDVLIEEEDDYYTIIPDYFQKISTI